MKACGNSECKVSTGIYEGLTFGSGDLNEHGFWENPCDLCARAWEKDHPQDGPCWPFEELLSEEDKKEIQRVKEYAPMLASFVEQIESLGDPKSKKEVVEFLYKMFVEKD